ncbi:MAG TPA: class I SAM-dependent methyltransferase [Solirubrobacteraceae bacterium]|nr:class I SAM-dependent methyltransferase [Solirubrobacteraceae bacterium]
MLDEPGVLEAGQVRSMFDRIARVYDPLNTAMTAGLHHRWRTRAADLARVGPGSRVLDVASGTGDLAIELSRRVGPEGEVLGCDFSERMLELARAKVERAGSAGRRPGFNESPTEARPRFEWADALALPYADGSFDAATVGFGIRNFSDLGLGLAEMVRVVRPGGRVVILEMTTPTKPPLSLFFKIWFDQVVPVLGRLIGAFAATFARARGSEPDSAIGAAYTYLPNSVKRFPSPRALAAEMERAGLREVSCLLTAGGIIAIHAGTVTPGGGPAADVGAGSNGGLSSDLGAASNGGPA